MRTTQSDSPAIMDDWLAVSTEGFASMNAGRDPAHLVKELVQNSLDAVGEEHGTVELGFAAGQERNTILVTCYDDGCGMNNLRDIRTVFYTSKTDSHLNRGRMGRGFKEMLCLARSATVQSGQKMIEFCLEAGRRITRQQTVDGSAQPGMRVTMLMPWPSHLIPKLQAYFQTFLPPTNVQLVVNGAVVATRKAQHQIEAGLPTELFEDGRWIRPSRKTAVELVPVLQDEEPTVYELGIPVCPAEWSLPLHADVLQRVPMNPCRDAVASGYLSKLHRVCLPVLLPDMDGEQVRQDWVGAAAPACAKPVQQEVIRRAFGENLARSVPKMGASSMRMPAIWGFRSSTPATPQAACGKSCKSMCPPARMWWTTITRNWWPRRLPAGSFWMMSNAAMRSSSAPGASSSKRPAAASTSNS